MKKLKQFLSRRIAPKAGRSTRDSLPDKTLRLNFHNAPLRMVLDYVSHAFGLIFEVKPNVVLNDEVNAWSNRPLTNDETLNLLEQILHEQGCALIRNGRRLAVMRIEDAKKSYIPIRLGRNHQAIFTKTLASRSLFAPASTCSN